MTASDAAPSPNLQTRADELFTAHRRKVHTQTDRLFAALLTAQWVAGVVVSLVYSPLTWSGETFATHLHVWASVLLGGAIIAPPVLLALFVPGHGLTRHTVAVGQMLMGALLIHLTGGRIETHFHIFGSLAFLAFYRDYRVLVSATLVVVADHFLRGLYFPQSIYGVVGGAELRFLEHAWWVVFEDVFLFASCVRMQQEMKDIALRHAELENSHLIEKQAEEMRRLAAKNEQLAMEAMAATRAKSEFLATMSHELRTPMNAIINYADLAIRRAAKAMGALTDPTPLQQQQRFATEIRSAGERLLSLINQLLDLSRIEAGKSEVHVEEATADDMAERVRKIAEPLMAQNENELTVACEPGLRFRTDVQKLEQCLINLVGNSAKFTHKGQVSLQISQTEANTAVIRVADTGIGMTHEQMEHLFVPFSQVDSSITRKYGGSGLGLAITKSIVALLGGSIVVESEQYKGSTFTITLPLDFEANALAGRASVVELPSAVMAGTGPTSPVRVARSDDPAERRASGGRGKA